MNVQAMTSSRTEALLPNSAAHERTLADASEKSTRVTTVFI